MPAIFPHCTFNLNPRPTSIDTPLHGFIPHRHVDHVHADAVIAIAAARNGERLTRTVFGGDIAWVPWQRPGFELGLTGRAARRIEPRARRADSRWPRPHDVGATSRACYETTLRVIQRAADWLDEHGQPDPFGPEITPALGRLSVGDAAG